jgi:hypothetical protein
MGYWRQTVSIPVLAEMPLPTVTCAG